MLFQIEHFRPASWIYAGMNKTKRDGIRYIIIELHYVEIDNGLLLWRKMLGKSPKIV